MTIDEINNLADDAEVVITGLQTKALLGLAEMFRSGYPPRGEDAFRWGTTLHHMLERAVELPPPAPIITGVKP